MTTATATDYAGIAQAIRETWEAVEANPSISREGALRILTSKLSSLFNCSDPDYSEREFFDLIDGDK